MRFSWLLSIAVGIASCLVCQRDRVAQLGPPSPPALTYQPHQLFVPEMSAPPLTTQGTGTR
jgi:hypothetical protein